MTTTAVPRNSTIVRNHRLLALRARFALGSWLHPRATLHRAYELFCTPLASSRERAVAAADEGARMSDFAYGSERLALYTWGDPSREPYVLFAHGWSSHALRIVPWIAALRASGHAVVAFDQVGHGRSSGRRSNLPDFAAALGAVARRHGEAAAIVGHSLGGAATMLALSQGVAAQRAILVAPAADPHAAASRFARFVGLAEHLGARLFEEYEATHAPRAAELQAHLHAPHIARPALIVHDLGDREVPWAEGERYARHWHGARLLTTMGLGHHRILDAPEVIDGSLRFLRGDTVGERVVSSPNLPYGFA